MFKAEIKYAGEKPSEEMHLEGNIRKTDLREGMLTVLRCFSCILSRQLGNRLPVWALDWNLADKNAFPISATSLLG